MRHQKRIVEAFVANDIQRILLIDDVYDPPAFEGVPGELTDFLESAGGRAASLEAGLSDEQVDQAREAALGDEADAEALIHAISTLYRMFVATREARFDPGAQFQTLKGATLDLLEPLTELLRGCGEHVDIRCAGLENGELVFREQQPQLVFLDFYLSAETASGAGDKRQLGAARQQSIDLLSRLLDKPGGEDPAIILMSSESVKKRAENFRLAVEAKGGNVIAVRFGFLQKDWVRQDGDAIAVANEAADTLLDTSQGFVFGQVLQQALIKWKTGAETALGALLKEIGGLGPKDFAYLFRFRLLSEGERMSDYLEWMFGESLRALVDEHVEWTDEAFKKLDDAELSKGIEGAFEGPSTQIARIFHRIRIDDHKSRPPQRHSLGDIYLSGKWARTVVTPDCDLLVRSGKTKVSQILTMGGELRSFDEDSASADQFVFRGNRPYSLKWNPKDLQTFPITGEGSLNDNPDYALTGTLRPLYAQEMQRQALTDLSRVGTAVAPAMGVDAKVSAWLRVKNGEGTAFEKLDIEGVATILLERGEAKSGHKVLLRRPFVHALVDKLATTDPDRLTEQDSERLADFLKEKNEDQLISGFLTKGSLTKDKGPLGTKLMISGKPDGKQDSPWLQLLLQLSDEGMEELLTVDPLLQLPTEQACDVETGASTETPAA